MHSVAVAVPFTGPRYLEAVLEGAAATAREHGAEIRVAMHTPGPRAHREVTESFGKLPSTATSSWSSGRRPDSPGRGGNPNRRPPGSSGACSAEDPGGR